MFVLTAALLLYLKLSPPPESPLLERSGQTRPLTTEVSADAMNAQNQAEKAAKVFVRDTTFPKAGLVWELKHTDHLVSKLRACEVSALAKSPQPSAPQAWGLRDPNTVLLFVRPSPTPIQTMRQHLKVLSCIYHHSVKGTDPVTKQDFTRKNWPKIDPDQPFPLDIYVTISPTEKGYRTLGLNRFGRKNLDLEGPELEKHVWRIIGLALSTENLSEAIRVDGISARVSDETDEYVRVIPIRAQPKPRIKKPKRARRKTKRRPSNKKAEDAPTKNVPRKLPQYR